MLLPRAKRGVVATHTPAAISRAYIEIDAGTHDGKLVGRAEESSHLWQNLIGMWVGCL